MRSTRWARWATCALAVSICVPAAADRRGHSVAECTAFGQAEKGDDAVAFTITNSCSIQLDCSISWQVVCAPDSKKRRAVHATTAKLSLDHGGTSSTEASASVCGDDSWKIEGISWACEPNKD
jgi:hypothetical protein